MNDFRTRGPGFQVVTDCAVRECLALILAAGVRHRTLGLPGEEELVGQGISYCAVCDGPFYPERPVAVVGGGDTALQDALFLAGTCSQVTLIHRRDQFRGERRLVDQVERRENIRCWMDSTVEELITRDGRLTGLRVRDGAAGEDRELAVDALFVAVGQEPRNRALTDLLLLDEGGYVMAGEDCKASLPGVFAAGDCRGKAVRQLTTAVGDGAVAGLAACRWVDEHQS